MRASEITSKDITTEAAVVAALALNYRNPEDVRYEDGHGNAPALLIGPKDVNVASLERFRHAPSHLPSITVALDSARDLHAYLLAQVGLPAPVYELEKQEDGTEALVLKPSPQASCASHDTSKQSLNPVIFASRQQQSITAFIDYHHAGDARWLNHTAIVQYSPSHQFKRWQELNNKQMKQEAFALFIDEMLQDFQEPTGAVMLSFATCLEAQSDQTFKSSTVLASGETELIFTDKRKGDVSTKIIDEFKLAIPIWQGSEYNVEVTAKLFHRLVDDKDAQGNPTGTKSLRFWYTLRHIERIIDKLFAKEVSFLTTAFSGIAPIYSGTAPTAPKPLPLGF